MATVPALIRNIWLQRAALTLVGGAAGFAYHFYVGCDGGCPLTGDPWMSTAYGAFVGFLVHPGRRPTSAPELSTPEQSLTRSE